jgi:hypothetical protein
VKSNDKTSGFTIVFGGPDFEPEEFLRTSRLKPHVIHRGDALRSGEIADESAIEFADVRVGTYPLDVFAEAIDFIDSHREEFRRLTGFPGIVTRTLNFFGDERSCTMEIVPAEIALLHELSLHVSICPYFQSTENVGLTQRPHSVTPPEPR